MSGELVTTPKTPKVVYGLAQSSHCLLGDAHGRGTTMGWVRAQVSLEPRVNIVKFHGGCWSSLWVGEATFLERALHKEPSGGQPHFVPLVLFSP